MVDERKKEFTLRVTQANRTQLIVIIDEMILEYIQDALHGEDVVKNIGRAKACVDHLKESLNFDYEIAGTLLHLYIHINKLLTRASVSLKKEYLEKAYGIVEKLRDNFEQIAKQDDSAPLTANAQAVYAGFTYGKNDINVNTDPGNNRGFLA